MNGFRSLSRDSVILTHKIFDWCFNCDFLALTVRFSPYCLCNLMKGQQYILITFLFTFWVNITQAQVNAYAEVTGVFGSTLTIGSQDETYDAFVSTGAALLYQSQDDVVSNFSNSRNFGNVSNIRNAGRYEAVVISSITRSGGTITSIELDASPALSFNTGTNANVQIISYPTLGSPDYTTTSDISAVAWNGSYGGVIAFKVDGVLNLEHSISVSEQGFRGGSMNAGGTSSCDSSTYFTPTSNSYADKGEGIYKVSNTNYAAARGKMATGGGGGNPHNGGGGGGSNFSAGGLGGPGWGSGSTACTRYAGGFGGVSLNDHITSTRVFMGGGGGAGEGNNNRATPGGDGGGVIFLEVDTLRTSGTCGGLNISANGEAVTTGSGNDGAGGAGAGGSIVLKVRHFDVLTTCPITISASGGDGGDVTHQHPHGGGGGGGLGAVYYFIEQPSVGITTETNPGEGGLNRNNSSTDVANNGGGSVDTEEGVFDEEPDIPLPVDLVAFNANYQNETVRLDWTTATEINNSHFEIYRKIEHGAWEVIGTVEGNGTSIVWNYYHFEDALYYRPEVVYYRLKQVDFDGTFAYSDVVSVVPNDEKQQISAYPNPAKDYLHVSGARSNDQYIIYSLLGEVMTQGSFENQNSIDLSYLSKGQYLLQVQSGNSLQALRFQVVR